MHNIFKDILIFSEDFIPFKCREMILTLLHIVIYNTSAFTLLTNHTYLHLKQREIPFSSGFLNGVLTSYTQALLKHTVCLLSVCV